MLAPARFIPSKAQQLWGNDTCGGVDWHIAGSEAFCRLAGVGHKQDGQHVVCAGQRWRNRPATVPVGWEQESLESADLHRTAEKPKNQNQKGQ